MNYLEQLLFIFTKDNRRAHGLNGNKQIFGFYIIIYIFGIYVNTERQVWECQEEEQHKVSS